MTIINAEVYPITKAYIWKYQEINRKIMTKRIKNKVTYIIKNI